MKIVNVVGYEGLYVATDNGDIYNVRSGIKMSQHINNGYLQVILSKNGVKTTHRVNRLIFQSFKGRIIDKLVIDHIDGNKLNNQISNLRQIHTRDNTVRAKAHPYGLGVHYMKNKDKYTATISIEGERFHLGTFNDSESAQSAYTIAYNKWINNKEKPYKRDKSKKFCIRCERTLPVTEFYYVKKHGYSYLCKECQRADTARRRKEKK